MRSTAYTHKQSSKSVATHTEIAFQSRSLRESCTVIRLDDSDHAILDSLRHNGRATVNELATATGLSASACSRRLRRLEDSNVIRGYRAIIDPTATGNRLTAFVAVHLIRHQREHIQRFQAGARKVPEITECHHVTGTFDYLLRVEVADLSAYERFHADQLAALHNVAQVNTYISMTDFSDL